MELVLDLLNNDSVFLLPSLPNKKTVCYSLRLSLFFYIALRASRQLHNRMLAAVLRSPLRFFDTNPLGGWGYCLARYGNRFAVNAVPSLPTAGRVLNRFSRDVGFLDDLLPYRFGEYLQVNSELNLYLAAMEKSFSTAVR